MSTHAARLRFTLLGCGSSGGVPRVGGDWGSCDPGEPRNRRRRCALLVERGEHPGKTRILVDTGPDLRAQMIDADVCALDSVLYTHGHADHLHGIDDLRPFALQARKRVVAYMDTATHARALHAFSYCFVQAQGSSYPPIVEARLFSPGRYLEISGPGGPVRALPCEVNHGDINAMGFRFADVMYLPDVKHIPDAARTHFENLDVLIIDALRARAHPSHFSLSDALSAIAQIRPARAILTNMHVDMDYRSLKNSLPDGVEPGYDGLVFSSSLAGHR